MSAPVARSRRLPELGLGLIAVIVALVGYVLVAVARNANLPPDLWALLAAMFGLFVVAHITVRRLAPNATATLLPLAAFLNGLGFVMISRIDRDLARTQALWTAIGIGAFIVTLVVVKRVRDLEQFRYTALFLGIFALLLPLVPGIGLTVNGARIWIKLGPMQVQPGEAAKVLLIVFFAAYLTEKRELIGGQGLRGGGLLRHLLPLVLAWGASMLVLVFEKDLGTSLIIFLLFAGLVYMATNRARYALGSIAVFVASAAVAYQLFGHVRERVQVWLDPWKDAAGKGYQIVQASFAFGSGGFTGRGLGLGSVEKIKIPAAETDSIFVVIGEELGFFGTVAIVIALLLIAGAGFRIAATAQRPFTKLFSAGLTMLLAFQAFVIIGGITRVIPLTGVVLPFISYGGSSLVSSWIIIALLIRMSDEVANEAIES
ncbi:MAG: FtsW/RodA/SpoVE family cell cycle protein [Acidimicrobiia bacterium]